MRLLWSQSVPSALRALCLARESETVFAWDSRDNLFLFNHEGTIQARRPAPVPLTAVGCADNGSAYVVCSSQTPMVCCLAPDLELRWQRPLSQRVTAVAVEPLGRCIAAADASGTLHLLNGNGRSMWKATTPRPLHYLAFVPEKQVLVGAADFGLVVCFGASGECLWRDGLVAHIGSLAVSGDGSAVLLACFSDGLYRYSTAGPQQQQILLETPCPVAALSYTGDCLLTADRQPRVCLRDKNGDVQDQINLESSAVALALSPLGDYDFAGLADGTILRLDQQSATAEEGRDLLK